MSTRSLTALILVSGLLISQPLFGKDIVPNPKAQRYLDVLMKAPAQGYLFDQFYNAWLSGSTARELRSYLQNISESSTGPEADILLALLDEKDGEYTAAILRYDIALKKSPDSAQILYLKGNLEAQSLAFDKAIADLQAALNKSPSDPLKLKIRKLLGKVYIRNGEKVKALKTWQGILDEVPENLELREDICELQLSEGLFDEAIKNFRQLISQTEDSYKAVTLQLRLAGTYRQANKKKKALDEYAIALSKAAPDSWLEREVLAQVENVFRSEDDITGLKKHIDELVKAYPKRIALLKQQARVCHQSGDTDRAMKVFDKLLAMTPGDRDIREQYVSFLVRANKPAEAAKVVATLTEMFPDDGEIYMRQANIYFQSENMDSALSALRKYLDVSEKSEFAYFRAARTLVHFNQLSQAMEVYDQLLEAYPKSLAGQEARAGLLFKMNKPEQAEAAYLAIAKDQNMDTVLRVAKALRIRGKLEAAYDLLCNRRKNLRANFGYLKELESEATLLKKYDEALKWTLERLELTLNVAELDAVLGDGVATAEKAHETDRLIEKFTRDENRTIPQTCFLVRLLESRGQEDLAEAVLAKALKNNRDSILLVDQEYQLARSKREFERAEKALLRLSELQPRKRAYYLRRLVDNSLKRDDSKQALTWVSQWKKASGGNSHLPYMKEAEILAFEGSSSEAVEVLRRASMKFPRNRDVLQKLATLYMADNDLPSAMHVYWRLLEMTENMQDRLRLVSSLADVAEMQDTTDKLVHHFETRAKTNSQSIFPLLSLAEIHRKAGNYDLHRSYLLKATRMRPGDLGLLYELARIELSEGEYDRAEATLSRAAELDKTSKGKQELAKFHLRYGDEDKGYQILFDLAGGKSMDAGTARSVADTLILAGQHKRACEFLSEMLPANKGNYQLLYLYAVALEESGRTQDALDTFLSFLDTTEELPGVSVAPTPFQSPSAVYMQSFAKIMPPGVIDVFEMQDIGSRVYAYRDNSSRFQPMLPGRGQSNSVAIPPNINELEKYVMGHLMGISMSLGDEENKALIRELEKRGVTYPELKLNIERISRAEDSEFIETLRKKNPDDDMLTALWLLMKTASGDLEMKELKPAFERFKVKYPQLAIMAVLGSLGLGEADDKLINEALDMLVKVEQPSEMLFQGALMRYWTGQGQLTNSLSPELRKKFNRAMITIYPKIKTQGGYMSALMLRTILATLAEGDDYQELVEFLDATANSPAKGQSRSLNMMFGMNRDRPELLACQLSFPPNSIPGFPDEIIQLFSKGEEGMAPLDVFVELDPEKLKPLVGKVSNPILKLIIMTYCHMDKEADSSVGALLAGDKPELGNYVVAAAYEAQRGKHQAAISLLEKARLLPMKKDLRRMIDSAILGHGLEVLENASAKSSAKSAALRLRRYKLSPMEREQLAVFMEQLGLKEESQKIAAKPTGGLSSLLGSFFSSSSVAVSPRTVQADTIETLVDKGKTEQATKLLLREYKSIADRLVRPVNQNMRVVSSGSWALREMTQKVVSHGLKEQFLEALQKKSAEGKNQDRLMYAYALEIFHMDKQAISEYKAALAEKPENSFANQHMATLLLKQNPEEARQYLLKAVSRNPAAIGEAFAEQINLEDDYDQKLQTAAMVVEVAKLCIPKEDAKPGLRTSNNNHWIRSTLSNLEEPSWNGTQIPRLFEAMGKPEKSMPITVRKFQERREEIYLALLNAAIQIPDQADFAFSRKKHFYDLKGKPVDEMVHDAKAIISNRNKKSSNITVVYFSSGGFSKPIPPISPEAFLAIQAVKTDKLKEFDEFVASLDSKKQKTEIQNLKSLKTLCLSGGQVFLDGAQKYLDSGKKTRQAMVEQAQKFADVITVWSSTGKKVSLSPMVLKAVKKDVKSRRGVSIDYASQWGNLVFKRQGQQAGGEYLDEFAVAIFGPSALAEAVTPTSQPTSQPNRAKQRRRTTRGMMQEFKTQVYGSVLEGVMGDPANIFTVLSHINHLSPEINLTDQGLRYVLSNQLEEGKEDWLRKTPLFKDWDEFDVGYLGQLGDNYDSILEIVVHRTEYWPRDNRKKYMDELKKIQPQTFGVKLIEALISEETPVEKTFICIGGHLDEIKQAPETKRKALWDALLNILGDRYGRYQPESEQAKVAHAYFVSQKPRKNLDEETEEFLAQRILRMEESESYIETAGRLIIRLLDKDQTKADKVFEHTLNMVEKRMRGYAPSYRSYIMHEMLERILQSPRHDVSDWKAARFILGKIQDIKGNFNMRLYDSWQLRDMLSTGVLQKLFAESRKKLIDAGVVDKQATVEAYVEVIGEMGEVFGTVRLPAVSDMVNFTTLKGNQREQVIEALKAREETSPLLKEVRLHLQANSLKGDQPLPEEFLTYYQNLMADENISVNWRLAVFAELAERFQGRKGFGPLELVAVRTATSSLKQSNSNEGLLLAVSGALLRHELQGEWKTAAEEFCEAWRKEVSRSLRRIKGYQDSELSSSDVVFSMIELYLKLGDLDNARKILANRSLPIRSNIETYTRLLKYPCTEWMSKQFSRQWQEMEWCDPGRVDLSPEMQVAAQKVLAGIKDENVRYFAQLVFAACQWVNEKGQPVGSPQKRLEELARDFSKRNISNKRLHYKCLQIFTRPEIIESVKNELYRFGESVSAESIAVRDAGEASREIYIAYLKCLIEDEKLDVFMKDIDEIVRAKQYSDSWAVSNMLSEIATLLVGHLCGDEDKDAKWTAAASDYLAALDAVRAADVSTLKYNDNATVALVVLFSICDKQEELQAFLESSVKPNALRQDVCMNLFAKAADSYTGEVQQAVVKGFNSFLNSKTIAKYLAGESLPLTSAKNSPAIKGCNVLRDAIERKARDTIVKLQSEPVEQGDKKDANLQMRLADCYTAAGEMQKAEAAARQWAEMAPGRESFMGVVGVLKEQGKCEEIVTLCEDFKQKYPKESYYYDVFLQALLDTNKNEQAVTIAQMCVEKFPRNGTALMDLGKVYYELGRYEDALQAYREAERSTDNHAYSHRIPIKIGMVNFALKRYDLAEKAARMGGGCDDQACKEAAELLKMVKKIRAEGEDRSGEKAPSSQPVENGGKG